MLSLPFIDGRLKTIRESTNEGKELIELKKVVRIGWPHHKSNVPDHVKQYWNFQDEIHVAEDLVFVGDRIIIPADNQEHVLTVLHESHF